MPVVCYSGVNACAHSTTVNKLFVGALGPRFRYPTQISMKHIYLIRTKFRTRFYTSSNLIVDAREYILPTKVKLLWMCEDALAHVACVVCTYTRISPCARGLLRTKRFSTFIYLLWLSLLLLQLRVIFNAHIGIWTWRPAQRRHSLLLLLISHWNDFAMHPLCDTPHWIANFVVDWNKRRRRSVHTLTNEALARKESFVSEADINRIVRRQTDRLHLEWGCWCCLVRLRSGSAGSAVICSHISTLIRLPFFAFIRHPVSSKRH